MASFERRPAPSAAVMSDSDVNILQYLVGRYGGDVIISHVEAALSTSQRLSVNCPALHNGSTGRELSPRTSYSSVHSSLSTFSHGTNASSATSVSDTSSTRGSMYSDTSSPDRPSAIVPQSPNPGHPSGSQKSSLQARAATNALHHANALHAAQKKSSHACPFCEEYGINLTCGRRSDLKKHLIEFHSHNTQWHCPSAECNMVFDVKSAFESHIKKNHLNLSIQTESAMARTCPQVVFACGFASCKHVTEAEGDATAKGMANKFFGHVVSHFDDHGNGTGSKWSYTTRFRNLMRQHLVDNAWKNRTRGYQQHGWQLQTSTVLRKMLETRHIPDVHLLVQYAASLANLPSDALKKAHFPQELFIPTPNTCPLAAHHLRQDPEGEWPVRGERFASPAISHPSTRPVTPAQFNNHHLMKVTTLESQAHLMPAPSQSSVSSSAESTVMGIEFPQPPQIRYYPPPAENPAGPPCAADASFTTRVTQHPLALYSGFSSTRASQLPQGAAVIADLTKRFEEQRPMTAADMAASQLRQQQPHPVSAYGGDGDMDVDVDMNGYAAGPFFNLL